LTAAYSNFSKTVTTGKEIFANGDPMPQAHTFLVDYFIPLEMLPQ
jgi:hypothetical protein